MQTLLQSAEKAKQAARQLRTIDSATKNKALQAIATALISNSRRICKENEKDLEKASEKGISSVMIDRLRLTSERITGIAEGVRQVIDLPDPIGEVLSMKKRPNGLLIGKRRVPLGVIGIIYESRPNVTVDTAVLCLKASNAVILRGGSDAFYSNKLLADIMKEAVVSVGLPEGCIELIEDTSRETVQQMMRLNGYIDVLIPRGGAGLIASVVQNATVPVIQTGVGNCHIYVDEFADPKKAADIVVNAKTSRPSVCNAAETLLVHKNVDKAFFSMVYSGLKEKNVEIRGCKETEQLLHCDKEATEEDYQMEFLDYILAVKTVASMDEAIAHIGKYSTGHSECIVTENYTNANRFLDEIDSAAVYVNASTRFTDGFEFGLGAEIGISTQKLHARGPMGLTELTTTKFIIYGNGQIR